MQSAKRVNADRVFFFDNIRYLMVLLVVVLHAASAYSNYKLGGVSDATSTFFDDLRKILSVFLMPTLFFIAGYFSLPSIQPKGTWVFIKGKFRRLGIPWLIGVLMMGSLIPYIPLYYRGSQSANLWNCFVNNINGALTFYTGTLASNTPFRHYHFWFISLLLLFFILFAIAYKIKSKLSKFPLSSQVSKESSNRSILVTIFLVSLLTAVMTFIAHRIFYQDIFTPKPMVIIVSLIQFESARIVLYIPCFGLGIYGFYKKWFLNGKAPGHFIFWIMLSVALWFCQDLMPKYMMIYGFPIILDFVWILVRTFLFFSILLALVSFGIKCWNNASNVNRLLAANSYNIYLIHLIFVIVMQFMLLSWFSLSIFIKFGIVTISAILFSYLISQYALRPFPRLSVAGMIVLFASLVLFLHPTAS